MGKVKRAGFARPSPVQMQGIPILFEQRDAIVLAETGSGKSLAFITPLIHLHHRGEGLKAIIVVPTRELAIQLYKEFLMFTSMKKGQGSNLPARVKFLRKALIPRTDEQFENFVDSCEVLISTPLKLAQLTDQYKLKGLRNLVIDEADKMFEMGFLE
jgi:superfamily II DNA/RNA helicase